MRRLAWKRCTLFQAQSWSDEEWQARAVRFANATREMAWIAFLNNTPCGMTTCYLAESVAIPTASLAAVWVDPAYRCKGVGETMVEAAVRWSESRRVEMVEARVTEYSMKAIEFYERNGFVRQETLPSPDVSDQEVLLVRELHPHHGAV